ncbi:uncharacterized protein B0T23DRAFT_413263 [Neurospora hispaniola]|uniref:Uncharacterized protein n=1 Tax=Neurospora hispaniola TaxID=588809 RepID=A0AAJ0I5A8_9PEZI|nr:hypothetical protein B0T23DRAFT_413263 [Neurospora hispaniola]
MALSRAIGRPEAQCHQRLKVIRAPNTDENGTHAPIERTDWDSQACIYEGDGEEGDSHLLTLTNTPTWLGFASNTRINGTSTSTPYGTGTGTPIPQHIRPFYPMGALTTGEARIGFSLDNLLRSSLARRQETISRRLPVGTKSRSSSRSV